MPYENIQVYIKNDAESNGFEFLMKTLFFWTIEVNNQTCNKTFNVSFEKNILISFLTFKLFRKLIQISIFIYLYGFTQ